MFDRLPYDPFRDFVPVVLISTIPNILVVHPDFPARNVQEFVAYAKANPGKVAVAHTGIGAITRLSGELLYDRAGIEVTTVAYGGSAPAHVDVLSGRVRALGVTSAQRVALLPEIPSIAEQGFPGFDAAAFYGLVAPKGTPPEVVALISAAIRAAVRQPDVRDKLRALTFVPGDTTPAQFEAFIRAEVALWGGLVRRRAIRPEG